MNREKLSEIISGIDEKYIDEATGFAGERSAALKVRRFRWGMAAACLLVVLALGSAVYARAAEPRTY